MNNSAIKIMRWAAFIGCGFGYYMSSNKQMYYNNVTPVLVGNEPTITNHEFLTSITVDQSFPLFVMAWIILAVIIVRPLIGLIRKKFFGYKEDEDEFDVHEGLEDYWTALKDSERQEWIDNENHIRKTFGIKVLEDDQLDDLKASKEGRKLIIDVPNYEILNNPSY